MTYNNHFLQIFTPPVLIRIHRMTISLISHLPFSRFRFLRHYDRLLKSLRGDYIGYTFFNARMICNIHDMIQSYIFHFGVWEPEISQIIENSLTTGDVFIDVGANIGYDSLLAAWRVGQLGKVVAIEASPTTFAMLEANLNLNEYAKNVRAVQIAASDRFEQLNLYNMPEHNIGASTTIASRAIGRGGLFFAKVQAKPLLEILHPEEIARVRLIKIDVEGAEPAIMSNILDSLHCFPANMEIIVETSPHDDYEASRNVFIRMKEAGFYAYVIENDYDRERYLSRALSLPVKTDELPDVQCDLFYTRRRLNCGP